MSTWISALLAGMKRGLFLCLGYYSQCYERHEPHFQNCRIFMETLPASKRRCDDSFTIRNGDIFKHRKTKDPFCYIFLKSHEP